MRYRVWLLGMAACVGLSCGSPAAAETYRLKNGQKWESVPSGPQEQYLRAIAEIKKLAREREAGELKAAIRQIKAEFPDRVGPDLDLYAYGELAYWQNNYNKALTKFEQLLKDYPGSEFAAPALAREFEMAQDYLAGRKKTVLLIFRISGYAEGIEIMEKVSDRAGLDEPNGIGLKAAIAVAEHYEAKEQYLSAYLKWAEIASYWETGPVGKRAIYRMAEDNLAAYDRHPPEKRPNYDASKLATARTYYEKFLALYPREAQENEVPQKIQHIDEQMACKQLRIGQFYRRTGKRQAANLYFNMVVQNWPKTEAAGLAREALEESLEGTPHSGK
jgi:outer membrane protein assembly factor BamD (BamD/ComL family)